ncbi:2-dehydropantoate 2-reductase [Baekduia soli]|uniref:2-dehydropantoate 2-reductase n=1 Tax=Baekduia soli TaxID=496014 RepID=A0A5B8U0G5_9ACTN|nr:2-dehydropantoate 2-reductase [Baekduia soli]QEC46452.1 2-dehydropantoate 2-reductase [Baekduia soli]
MRIAIVGVGAMGAVYAGLLGRAGNEVWAIDVDEEHVAAMRERGLRVEGASGDSTVAVHATTDAGEAGEVDLVVIATKAHHVQDAARAAAPLLGDDTLVLSIQNGLGSADRVAAVLGEDRVAMGVVGGFGASIRGPGHVHHHGLELVRLGERRGPVSPRIERVADVWRAAGFTVNTYDDVHKLVWEKLICNVAFSGPCAMTGLTIQGMLDSPSGWWVSSSCAEEAYAVARAMDVDLGFDDASAYVRAFGEKIPGARPSMLLDVLAGRRTEVDVINGAIGPLAHEHGVPAPVNETVTALVRVKDDQAGQGHGG